jgi:hypothetical protein
MTGPTTLASILRMPADPGGAFLSALSDWVLTAERQVLPFDKLPEPARQIIVLNEIYSALDSTGMLYVIDWNIGDQFHDVVKWAKLIGARHTVDYFTAAAAQFPRKRVPKERELRRHLYRKLSPDLELFTPLDDRYREKVLAELPRRFKAYLTANRAAVEKKLESRTRAKREESPDEVIPYTTGDAVEWRMEWETKFEQTAAEGRLKAEGFAPEVVRIGDVVEVKSRRGVFYLHATHEHALWRLYGPVMRVLPGFHKPALATLDALVAGPTKFHAVVRINEDLAKRRARVVGNFEVPSHEQAFPTFRYALGKTRDGRWGWLTWKGGETGIRPPMVEPLTDAQRALPVFEPEEAEYVGMKLAKGDFPASEVNNPGLYED